jgi:hypothetical protein
MLMRVSGKFASSADGAIFIESTRQDSSPLASPPPPDSPSSGSAYPDTRPRPLRRLNQTRGPRSDLPPPAYEISRFNEPDSHNRRPSPRPADEPTPPSGARLPVRTLLAAPGKRTLLVGALGSGIRKQSCPPNLHGLRFLGALKWDEIFMERSLAGRELSVL